MNAPEKQIPGRAGHPEPNPIPRGIEVLVKKAAVDPEFCQQLIDRRGDVAGEIGLELDAAEYAMLRVIPREQLAQIIQRTNVPVEHRRVFLGRVAATMLAVLGAGLAGCEPARRSRGIQPDRPGKSSANAPPAPAGIQPDRP